MIPPWIEALAHETASSRGNHVPRLIQALTIAIEALEEIHDDIAFEAIERIEDLGHESDG